MKKELTGIQYGRTWVSYIGSAYGALTGAKLWQGEIWELLGMSGMAFNFIVHETACPSSVTMYEWYNNHFQSMDRIGVFTEAVFVYNQPGMNTYASLKATAIEKIKRSIDAGKAVVVWAPTPILEFGIIRGYDDVEQVFTVIDCANENPDPLLYDNLGKSEVPCLYLQYFLDAVPVDKERIFRESLNSAVYQWQQPQMAAKYGNGKAAYDNLVNTLEAANYNEFGLSYLINVYADTKRSIVLYMDHISRVSGTLQKTAAQAALYKKVADHFGVMCQITPFQGPGAANIDKARIPEMIKLVKECRELESEAIRALDDLLKE